jgi:hypothetical protein
MGFTHYGRQLGLEGVNEGACLLPVFWQRTGATGIGWKTGHTEQIFHRHRYAHQRPGVTACSPYLVSGTGKFERRLRAPTDIGTVITRLSGINGRFDQSLTSPGSGLKLLCQLP